MVQPQGTDERSETILLVEDNDMVRGLAHTVLAAQHYTVLSARSAEEALSMPRRQTRPIALLATDMIMPGMGGAQLAAELRTLQPSITVIITSGYADREGRLLEYVGFTHRLPPKPLHARLADEGGARGP